jgi:hypothetical protein
MASGIRNRDPDAGSYRFSGLILGAGLKRLLLESRKLEIPTDAGLSASWSIAGYCLTNNFRIGENPNTTSFPHPPASSGRLHFKCDLVAGTEGLGPMIAVWPRIGCFGSWASSF